MGKINKTIVESLSVSLADSAFPVVLTRRNGQKHIRIRISLEGKVTISAPPHTSHEELQKVLKQKESWIIGKLQEVSGNSDRFDPLRTLYLNGQPYTLDFTRSSGRRFHLSTEHKNHCIHLSGPSESRAELEYLLAQWLRQEAKKTLIPLAEETSRFLHIPYRRIFLRNQRSRWGSSSSRGNISLNWRVVMLSPAVQRYLIIHELAHQRELNHSIHFWKLVERFCPNYRDHEKNLKAYLPLMGLFRSPRIPKS